jgi:undecaprenyl-diphosphatase
MGGAVIVPFVVLNAQHTSDERYLLQPRHTLWLGAVLLALFVLLALVVPTEPLTAEQRWQALMKEIQTPFLKDVALVFNFLGRGIGLAIVFTLIGSLLVTARRWHALAAAAIAEGLTALTSSVTKAWIGRERPPDGLVHPASSSFPSGHTAFAGTTSVALVLLFTSVGPRRRLWWSLAILATAAMGWSRTYLQVHWLLDVLAGAALGIGIALTVFAVAQVMVPIERLRSSLRSTAMRF